MKPIPPPFRGVSSAGMGSSSGAALYQSADSHTSSEPEPRVVSVPWSQADPAHLAPGLEGAWSLMSIAQRFFKGSVFLSRVSPLLTPLEHVQYTRPGDVRTEFARVTRDAEGWRITPVEFRGARCAVDGRWCSDTTPVGHGAIVDVCVGWGGPIAFQLLTDEVPAPVPPDDAAVAVAIAEGAFVLIPRDDGSFDARLAGGPHSLKLDSLGWLERLRRSPLQKHLRRLELEVWHPDAVVDLEAFVEKHHALARLTPFEVNLIQPRRKVRPPVSPRPTPLYAVFPGDGWEQVPLVEESGCWVLKRGTETVHFVEGPGGPSEVEPSGEPRAKALGFFRTALPDKERWPRTLSGFFLMPGPSSFITGQKTLGSTPLTRETLAVFADRLNEAHDAAGPLLAMVCANDDPQALTALWGPYGWDFGRAVEPAFGGKHCCGFFEELDLGYWVRIERELPILARHPMLQRLRVMRIHLEPYRRRAAVIDPLTLQLQTALAACPVPFKVFFEGHLIEASP